MSRKDISLEHPMAADRQRVSKAKDILEDSKQLFNKLDEKKASEKSDVLESKTLNSPKIKSIKDLLYSGSINKVVEIDGFFFKLKTLTNHDVKVITRRILSMQEEDRLIESNVLHLASSLVSINGLSPSDAYRELLEKESDISELDKNLEIISVLNATLVGKLIDEYFKLAAESKNILETNKEEEVKDTVKNIKK